jgi:hypothetical protein
MKLTILERSNVGLNNFLISFFLCSRKLKYFYNISDLDLTFKLNFVIIFVLDLFTMIDHSTFLKRQFH